MNSVLPIALLGVAAFFIYRYYSEPGAPDGGALPSGGGTSTLPSGGGTSTLPSGGGGTLPSGGGSSPPPGSGSTGGGNGAGGGGGGTPPPQLSQAEILQGAAVGVPDLVHTADQYNWQLNVDQWNWYREQGGGEPIDPSYMPALLGDGERTATISASEYRRRLASNGLGYLIPVDVLRWQ